MIKISTFSERLIKYRTSKGITKRAMSEKLNMPYTTYQNYENGREPKLDIIQEIASVLGIPTNFLISDMSNQETSILSENKLYTQALKERKIFNIVCKLRDIGIDYSTDINSNSKQGILIFSNDQLKSISILDQELLNLEKQTDDYFKLKIQELVMNKTNHFLFFFNKDE